MSVPNFHALKFAKKLSNWQKLLEMSPDANCKAKQTFTWSVLLILFRQIVQILYSYADIAKWICVSRSHFSQDSSRREENLCNSL